MFYYTGQNWGGVLGGGGEIPQGKFNAWIGFVWYAQYLKKLSQCLTFNIQEISPQNPNVYLVLKNWKF